MKKNMKQAHGKNEFVPTTLDQLWGDTGTGRKYNTLDETEYLAYIQDMNKSDLQSHAVRIGMIPVDNRETLEKRLLKEFRVHVAGYTVPQIKTKSKVPSKEVEKILAEGR